MKILVVTPTFLPIVGGAELGIHEIFKRLGKLHKVRILTPTHSQLIYSQQGAKDIDFSEKYYEVHHFKDTFNLTKIRGQRIFGRLIPPLSFSYVWAIFKQIRTFRPDIIIFHYVIPAGLALILTRKLTKIPVVLSLISRIDVLNDDNKYFKKHRIYFLSVLKAASCIISNSKYYLGEFYGRIPVSVIPYGVDTKRFSPKANGEKVRESLGIDKNKVILFALQRLVKVKRVDILIKSFKYILEVNKDVFLVIGGKGYEEQSLKTLAKKIGVYDNVIFTGYISEQDIPNYFAMSNVFVFSSPNETFGIVIAQGMASGKPIVAINSTAIPEVVDNCENGLLVESLNPKEFAAAVIKLLDSKDILKKYSENGRKKAVKKYDWNVIAQQYDQKLKNLARKGA